MTIRRKTRRIPTRTATVRWGEQTNDEMLVGYVEVALADQDLGLGGPGEPEA